MVVALFVPSCVVVVDAGWKKERARRRARLKYLSGSPRKVNKAEFGSPPKFLLPVLESHLC
jgi:hypothetical protein